MVSLDALLYTLIVGAHNWCYMVTFDIPAAYLHADIPNYKKILMKLRGDFIDITCQVNPEYEQDVRYEDGNFFCIYW